MLVGGAGIGLILPAFTTLAASSLPEARLLTGIGVQTAFRQIGAALGLAAFVAIVGDASLATTSDYHDPWLFMAIAAAGSGLILTPLFGRRPRASAVEARTPTREAGARHTGEGEAQNPPGEA
jgi:MFS family permease